MTASFPNGEHSWEARSKDHDISDPAQITAYAIGIKPRPGAKKVRHIIRSATGPVAPHPSAQVCLEEGWIHSGGGAFDNWSGDGNLLTASFPNGQCWIASGKDHMVSDPAAITAYVIGLR